MSDPGSIITQVSQDDQPPPRSGLFNSFLCCWGACFPSVPASSRAASPPPIAAQPLAENIVSDSGALLPPLQPRDKGRVCLVLDLDETLVHSSFRPVPDPDFIVPIEIDGTIHQVYVLKRPHVDVFLKRMGDLFEVVLFTASLSKYADPVSDLLDTHGVFRHRLFREHCVYHYGNYVKDLRRLGRDIRQALIVDNSPASYAFTPENAVAVTSWFNDRADTELLDLIPFFEDLARVDNVIPALSRR